MLRTTTGKPVEVIDAGLPNTNAGPDFFNAKLKIDGTLWVGNVEVHTVASDWMRHGHDKDVAYDNVILHVAETVDCEVFRANGAPVPQLQLSCPESIRRHYAELTHAEIYPPCYSILSSLPKLTVHSWLSALQVERFEQKARAIAARLEHCNNHWEDVFFITLSRNFGFGLNGDAFEAWANHLPFRAIDKHRDNLFQVEAFFFGQAGLLDEELPDADTGSYRKSSVICSISLNYQLQCLPLNGVFSVCVPAIFPMSGWRSWQICIIRSARCSPASWKRKRWKLFRNY